MGINKLNDLIKTKNIKDRNIFRDIPRNVLAGTIMAVDCGNLAYINMGNVRRRYLSGVNLINDEPDDVTITNLFLNSMLNNTIEFIKYGISPVMVFDGKFPKAKSIKHDKKADERQKVLNSIEENKQKGANYPQYSAECQKELVKLYNRLNYVSFEQFNALKHIFQSLGISVVQAETEAEKCCATLYFQKRVQSVYSTDTDCLVYAVDHIISNSKTWGSYKFTSASEVRDVLGLDYNSFMDMCIMMGCDYNNNIFNYGMIKCYKLISKCKYIEAVQMEDSNINNNIKQLDHLECRRLFTIDVNEDIDLPHLGMINKEVFNQEASEVLNQYNLNNYLSQFNQIYYSN